MALLKNFKEIEPYIPDQNEKFYMSVITRTPKDVIESKPLFGFVYNKQKKIINKIFKVSFAMFSTGGKTHYMYVSDETKDLTSNTLFISTKTNGGLTKKDWKFITNEIGLHVITENTGNEIVYFGTNYTDARELREKINSTKIYQTTPTTIITETIYI